MKKIEDFFYELRQATKNDDRNKDWAKKDAHKFCIGFKEIFPNKTVDEAFQFLNEFKNKQDKDTRISKLNALIKSHFSQLQHDKYKLSSPYQRSKKILKEWLSHWSKDDLEKVLTFLYKRYGSLLKQDSSAILEIIQELFIKAHHYEPKSLNLYLVQKIIRNKDFYKKEPELEEYLLADGLYSIMAEPNIYTVYDFYNLLVQKFDLSKNGKKILDIAYELCKQAIAGKTPSEKRKNFKKLFKEKLEEEGLTGNTLNQALKRLRDKLSQAPDNAIDDETPMGMLMGFKVEEIEPTPHQEKQIKALEFLLEIMERKG